MVDDARRDAAEREPGRELGGVVRAEHAVARVKVGRHRARVPQVVLEAPERCALAAHKVDRPLRRDEEITACLRILDIQRLV